ncbi:MAG TPA: 3-hydroxyacyl-CoA dehydrogenase NAD-binding domain-containing protein [Candidatus Micrarchaeia archaeon]|nr:3-hydroxyacyl-CoA dehydrogenase NAD-binding domain-containing protein [Candidatus Micrarchaeia archaeon]
MPVITDVGVVGAGVVGRSWVRVFRRAGVDVRLFDRDRVQLERARVDLDQVSDSSAAGGQPVRDGETVARTGHVTYHEALADVCHGVTYIQEAAPEDLAVKRAVIEALDGLSGPDVILASSTSALLMTDMAAATRHPERCVVVHPTNPPHLLPLVEVVPGQATDRVVVSAVVEFMRAVGQVPIICRKEVHGFVLNRLQFALTREAFHLVREGVASLADVDRCVTDGLGPRWAFLGPFAVEHTNAEGIGDGMKKFAAPIQRVFAEVAQSYGWPTTAEVQSWEEELDRDLGREDLVKYRDAMLGALRELKSSQPRPGGETRSTLSSPSLASPE